MQQGTTNQNFGNLVNYSNVPTSAPNEIYVSTTETPDSKAFLMKNNITIEFTMLPGNEDNNIKFKEQQSTSIASGVLWP